MPVVLTFAEMLINVIFKVVNLIFFNKQSLSVLSNLVRLYIVSVPVAYKT